MKLSIVVTVLGQHEMATLAIQKMVDNCMDPTTQIVVIDNGGDFNPPYMGDRVVIERRLDDNAKPINMGVYPAFEYAMDYLTESVTGDVVAFFHSDVMINEKGFDSRVLSEFEKRKDLGLMGFVGSTEIDVNGGRGGGTTSNFQGLPYRLSGHDYTWHGSAAEAHGKRDAGYTNAAVVDGCVMIITREAWKKIGYRKDFPPHHFYDRLISTQMIEAGYKVAVLGVAFDHLGGQTVSRESRYNDVARKWCEEHNVPPVLDPGTGTANWDYTIYVKGEAMWLLEYRHQKHLVPIRV